MKFHMVSSPQTKLNNKKSCTLTFYKQTKSNKKTASFFTKNKIKGHTFSRKRVCKKDSLFKQKVRQKFSQIYTKNEHLKLNFYLKYS